MISINYRIICILIISLYFIPSSCIANPNAIYKTDEVISLSGTINIQTFLDANDHPEDAFILKLSTPIAVQEDEFGGPVSNVSEVQLVIPHNINGKELLSKQIIVEGMLFYPITAHHHTPILLELKKVSIIK